MLDRVTVRIASRHAQALEGSVRAQVGLVMRSQARVTIRRPWWMPDRLYRWLMRTIVVELTGPTVRPSDDITFRHAVTEGAIRCSECAESVQSRDWVLHSRTHNPSAYTPGWPCECRHGALCPRHSQPEDG